MPGYPPFDRLGFDVQNIPLTAEHNSWNHFELTVKNGGVPSPLDNTNYSYQFWMSKADTQQVLGADVFQPTMVSPIVLNGTTGSVIYVEFAPPDFVNNGIGSGTYTYEILMFDSRDSVSVPYKIFKGLLIVPTFLS